MFSTTARTFDRTAEPLRAELSEFLNSVRNGTTPKVTGRHGLDAVVVASEIDAKIGRLAATAAA